MSGSPSKETACANSKLNSCPVSQAYVAGTKHKSFPESCVSIFLKQFHFYVVIRKIKMLSAYYTK